MKFYTWELGRNIAEDICHNKRPQITVKSLINARHEMENTLILGKVWKNRKQMRLLNQMRCNMIQGYLIGGSIIDDVYKKIHCQ